MLLVVIGCEVRLLHVLARIDGQRSEGVVRILLCLAPDGIVVAVLLDGPIHIGQQDGMELQTLTLVDGEDADTVDLAGWDRAAVDGLVPCLQEGVDVRWIAAQVVLQLVHKSKDVGVLTWNPV